MTTKLAFVIPWHGPEIPGGAENLCRNWAHHLAEAGKQVEILTTTIKEFQSNWNIAHYRPGIYGDGSVTVRRFALRPGDHHAFNLVNRKLLAGLPVSLEQEKTFFKESVNSDALIQFIEEQRPHYLFLFIPYLYGTTYHGIAAAGDRSILIPCLHDEPYARMRLTRQRLSAVQSWIFNSHPEQRLAERLYGISPARKIVLGMGLPLNISGDAQAFRRKFLQEAPFLLYVGRKDRTKNTDLLLAYFKEYKRNRLSSRLQLLLAGVGQETADGPDIRDLGYLAAQDKYDCFAAAQALCNPSVNESFSIVLMESWLCGTPVLVNSHCPVTRDFAQRGRGGLCFSDYYEFEASLDYLTTHRKAAAQMASQGADLVSSEFSWPRLLGRFQEYIRGIRLDL
ncbi:MAG: glycosyltransferase family 4 protein [Acidobacteriota bacterium]